MVAAPNATREPSVAVRFRRRGREHIVSGEGAANALERKLAHGLDCHLILHLQQHARADEIWPDFASSQRREARLVTLPTAE